MSVNQIPGSYPYHAQAYPQEVPLSDGESVNNVEQQRSSLSSRVVEWISADRPYYQRIVVYAIAAVAAVILCVSCVGIPFLTQVATAHKKQTGENQLRRLDQPIINIIGGEDAYENLPVYLFDTKDARYEGACPSTQEITAPIMRGTDKYGRPVLFFKIYDRTTSSSFVEMIYRQYSLEGKNNPWIRNPNGRSIFDCDIVIEGKALERLNRLFHRTLSPYSLLR